MSPGKRRDTPPRNIARKAACPAVANSPTSTAATVDALVPITNTAGFDLSNVVVQKNGVIFASYSDGSTDAIGRIAIATFVAPDGLRSIGQTNWQATGLSGAPGFQLPGIGNAGEMFSGALERSNVDLAEELVSLITAQRNFQANARAIDTATQISQTIINLRT